MNRHAAFTRTASTRTASRRSVPTLLVALLALVVGAGLGLAALWWWLPEAEADGGATDGPASDAAHTCAIADVLPDDLDPAAFGAFDADPAWARLGALSELATAAAVGDDTYAGLDEQGQLLVRHLQTYDQQGLNDSLTALRAECDRLGLTVEE